MIKGAVPVEAWMHLSRKVTDGNYGSEEKLVGLRVALTPDTDLESVWIEIVKELVNQLAKGELATVSHAIVEKTETSTKAQEGFPLPAQELEDAKETEPMAVYKFTFEKRTDGKYQLGLFEKFGDKIGQWPSIKFTAERDEMWKMIGETIGTDFALNKLPVEYECSYWADWKYGRQKKDSDKRYQDLVALRAR